MTVLTSGVTAISSGAAHTCALLVTHIVKCWGFNAEGQLGDGSQLDSHLPVIVHNLSEVQSIAAGAAHTCAVLAGGSLKCWGSNFYGQLGIPDIQNSLTPAEVNSTEQVVQVAALEQSTCVLKESSAVQCFGNIATVLPANEYWQPRNIPGMASVRKIVGSKFRACGLLVSRMVKCWDTNTPEQLGNGTTTDPFTPIQTNDLSDIDDIGVNNSEVCVATLGGTVRCWGNNSLTHTDLDGLSDVTQIPSTRPGAITALRAEINIDFSNTITISWAAPADGGQPLTQHVCQISTDGQNWSGDTYAYNASFGLCRFEDLIRNRRYKFRVASINAIGQSDWTESGFIEMVAKPNVVATLEALKSGIQQIRLVWSAPSDDGGSSILGYQVQQRLLPNGSWVNVNNVEEFAPTFSSVTAKNLIKGGLYEFRVSARNNIGIGQSSNVVESTMGLGEMYLTIKDSEGKPVEGGNFSWISNDLMSESTKPTSASASGIVLFPAVVPGMGRISVSNLALGNEIYLSGQWWNVSLSAGSQNLTLPSVIKPIMRRVRVTLPSGVPVPGALVMSPCMNNITGSGKFRFEISNMVSSATTDNDGYGVLHGYATQCGGYNANTSLLAIFDDGVLKQTISSSILTEPIDTLAEMQLTYMPYVEVADDDLRARVGDAVPITFVARDSGGDPQAGQMVAVKIPAGMKSTISRCRPKLQGTSNSRGQVFLKLCAVKSAKYAVSTPGSVAIKSLKLTVAPSRSSVPTSLSLASPSKGSVKVKWAKPAFDGGSSITGYKLSATCAGSSVGTKTAARTATSFTWTGLPKGKTCSIGIQAQNSKGLSNTTSKLVTVKK